ncbi:ATP-binding protein [Spirillospora sp. CA-253888]
MTAECATLVIKAQPELLRDARHFVGKTFAGWGLDAYIAQLAVTELVTNVIRHTDSEQATVRLYVAANGPVVEVWDDSDVPPVVHSLDGPASESGRGLAMLQILAVSIGWAPVGGGGKAVHAVLQAARP